MQQINEKDTIVKFKASKTQAQRWSREAASLKVPRCDYLSNLVNHNMGNIRTNKRTKKSVDANKLDTIIKLRTTQSQAEMLKNLSDSMGMSRSDYLLALLEHRIKLVVQKR